MNEVGNYLTHMYAVAFNKALFHRAKQFLQSRLHLHRPIRMQPRTSQRLLLLDASSHKPCE